MNNNKTQPVASFIVVKRDRGYNIPENTYPTVTMEIEESATISDMLDAFKNFLLAMGYVIDPGAYLDVVEEDKGYFDTRTQYAYDGHELINENKNEKNN